MQERLEYLRSNNKLVEAQRLEQRTRFDLEMILELGYCNGIEKLLALPFRASIRRGATHALRLSAGRRLAGDRRIPRQRAAGRRDV